MFYLCYGYLTLFDFEKDDDLIRYMVCDYFTQLKRLPIFPKVPINESML